MGLSVTPRAGTGVDQPKLHAPAAYRDGEERTWGLAGLRGICSLEPQGRNPKEEKDVPDTPLLPPP